MERRQFLTAGTGTILGLAGLGRAGASVQSEQEQDENDLDALVSLLEANLGEMGVEVFSGGRCLGNGVLATTTRAEETTDDILAEEVGIVAGTYAEYLDIAIAPPEIGLVVEVYESSDDVGNRQNRFARYSVDTMVAKEALETGNVDPLVLSVVLNVWPPVVEELRGPLDEDDEGDQKGGDDEPGGRSDLELVEHEAIDYSESDDETSPALEANVENRGSSRSGDVELVVDWYDVDGTLLTTDRAWLESLFPDETWAARVYPPAGDESNIADYQTSLIYDDPQYTILDGVSIVESQLTVGDEARIFGEFANETGEELSYVEIVGRFLDADGRILDDDWTTESDISAGQTWRFDLSYRDEDRARLNAIEEYELLVLA